MIKVLMVGPARNVKGGMSTVINNYYDYGLDKKVDLTYIETINDKSKISKFFKEKIGFFKFINNINNYDIIHIHMASGRSTFRKCKYIRYSFKKGKKIVLHIHGGGFTEFYKSKCNIKQQKYIKETINMCDALIVLSKSWVNFFETIFDKKRIYYIPNGVFVPNYYEKELDNHNIIYLGRIEKDKGIYDLLYAIKEIKLKYPLVQLYLCGVGDNLTEFLENNNLNNNVKLLGWIDNKLKDRYLKECAYFCLPSYYEAMPVSLLEAMAYGCIPIVSNVGSVPDVVINNENGIIVEPGNILQIVKSFDEIFINSSKKESISSKNRKDIIKKYSIETSIMQVFKIYEDIMKNS